MSSKLSQALCWNVAVLSLILFFTTTGWAQSSQDEERWKTDPRLSEGQIAPLLNGMGEHSHLVTVFWLIQRRGVKN